MKPPRTFAIVTVIRLALLAVGLSLSACSSQVKAPSRWNFSPINGHTPYLQSNGYAAAPNRAPEPVKRAVAAANEIAGRPYKWGGGHGQLFDTGYDCSGMTGYVLNRSGLMRGPSTSEAFLHYGDPGPGKWITLYAKDGHVFLDIGGLRFDTGGSSNSDSGPAWKTQSRTTRGFVLRHPPGL
jgi:hypothetical protein